MKTWQKLAITAGVILVAATVFIYLNNNATGIFQTIIDWVFEDVFGFNNGAPSIF